MSEPRGSEIARSLLGDDHGITVPPVEEVDAREVPLQGPSFGVERLKDGTLRVGLPAGPLQDAVLAREILLAGFSPKARRKTVVLHACNWVAWCTARGTSTRAAFWNAWARPVIEQATGLGMLAVPPTLLLELNRASADPLIVYKVLRQRIQDAELLAGRVYGIESMASWARELVAVFLPVPSGEELLVCLAATRVFIDTGEPPSKASIIAESGTSQAVVAKVLPWLVFLRNINIGFLETRYVMVACTSAYPTKTLDSLLDVPGMSVRHSIIRGALAGEGATRWHTSLFTFAVPSGSVDAFARFIDALTMGGLFSDVITWVLDATTTAVNFNRHDPGVPAFTFAVTNEDDPARVVGSTVDYQAGLHGARVYLSGLVVRDPVSYIKFLETLSSPFRIAGVKFGAHEKRLSMAAKVRRETVTAWMETHAATIAVPHPRAFFHVMPYYPGLSTLLAFTPSTMTRTEKDRFTAPFMSWQANTAHRTGTGKDGIAWFLRVPEGFENGAFDHVTALVPASRCGLMLQQEHGLKQPGFLSWFDFNARAHVDTASMLDALASSARNVVSRVSSITDHEALVRRWDSTRPPRGPGR